MKSSKPSAIENLDRFKRVLEGLKSFRDREQGIERARAIKDSNLRQGLEEQKVLLAKEQGAEVAKLETAKADAIEVLAERVAEKKRRIDQAQIVVRNQVIDSIQAREGKQKATVQRQFMDAERAHNAALETSTRQFEEDSERLKELSTEGVELEKRAISSVRVFDRARKLLIESLRNTSEHSLAGASLDELARQGERIRESVTSFQKEPIVKLFRIIPLPLQIFFWLLLGGGVPFLSAQLGGPVVPYYLTLGLAAVMTVVLVILFFRARSQALQFAEGLAEPISDWKRARISFKEHVAETFEKTQAEAKQAFNAAKAAFGSGLSAGSENGGEGSKYAGPEAVEARASELHERLGNLHEKQVQRLEERFREDVAESKSALEKRIAGVGGNQTEEEIAADLERQFENLVSQWNEAVPPVHRRLLEDQYDASLTELLGSQVDKWEPPSSFEGSLPFGVLRFAADPDTLPGPESESLALDGPAKYDIPLRLRVPDAASVFVESKSSGREASIELLNFLSLGWLVSSPAGRLSFSFFDPVGLGESFAGLMHLSDYEEILINSRIRTREDQIEARLGELCEHMEKVIQMYLRNDYETITEYNEAAGTIAERYHFVVIADFPNGFSDLALQRLQSIATSGARCGVFLLAHVDTGAELPRTAQLPELQRNAIRLIHREGAFHLPGIPEEGAVLSIESLPEGADFGKWVHRIGEANRDSNRIEVPFSFIAPEPEQRWTGSTKDEISVPIGRSGATKLQYLSLGKGTCQHALIAGKTGSGKSTLFHVIVTNLALWCDPDEVEFYLIDFKKGVEFKCYADQDLPHARVIAIESDREFGLSVLQRLDRELRERGELFRAAGVQDVPGYRSLEDGKKLPRTLLLIDEFQEFFIEDDSIAQQAAVLLDRIVRQGRAFGIHAVLGSQTLGGAFTLARATLGQMTVRVALACNEADAYLIMDDSNPAPRLLTRPGEGIYNDRAGAMEANSPFQVVWMEENERDELLDGVSTLASEQEKGAGERVIFEGNAPGEIAKDGTAAEILKQGETSEPTILLGAPNSIKDSTGVSFRRQSGANLLFVGPRDDVVEAVVPIALTLLRSQLGEKGRLILFDPSLGTNEPYAERVSAVDGVETPDGNELDQILTELDAELKSRVDGEEGASGAPVFLFVPSLQRLKKLRYEEDFSFSLDEDEGAKPATIFNTLICEGPGWGIHIVTSLDSLNNVNRCLGRKAIGEFEKKVLFQMSATDSASLIDSGAASGLGLNRAAFYDESQGVVEIFRPYAEAPLAWWKKKTGHS